VVTRGQLRTLGFSPAAIEHRIRTGRLRPTQRGVYLVGWPGMSNERRWMVSVLACGDRALLSHRSAAALWQIGFEPRGRTDVSVRRRCDISRPGLRIRVRAALLAEDVTRRSRIPVTTPVRTLIERAVNQADKYDLLDPEALREVLVPRTGQPGVKRLASLLDRHTFRLSDSDLEIYFRPLAAESGLPVPLTKDWVLGFEVDFHFPTLDLLVETDGLRYHRTPSQQARAVRRDQTHTAAGLRVLRFTHWQIAYEPEHVREVLGRMLRFCL
jgi:hypothetical protein